MTLKDEMMKVFTEGFNKNAKYVFTEMYIDGYESSEIIVNPMDNVRKKAEFIDENYDEDLKNHRAPVRILSFGYCDDMSELEYVYHGEVE